MEIFKIRKEKLFISIFGTAAFTALAYYFYKKIISPYLNMPNNNINDGPHIFLTKEDALKRSSIIKNPYYTLYFNLLARSHIGKILN